MSREKEKKSVTGRFSTKLHLSIEALKQSQEQFSEKLLLDGGLADGYRPQAKEIN